MADKKKSKPKAYKPVKGCPKCGKRLAEHANRLACGFCGYMEVRK